MLSQRFGTVLAYTVSDELKRSAFYEEDDGVAEDVYG
jgi:hypothetical protein